MSRNNIKWLPLAVAVLMTAAVSGQIPGVLTNEELNLQRLFIEANREKLLGNYDEAARLYEQVLNEDPRNDAASYELSRVYDYLERYDDALSQITSAIRVNADNPWYRLMKADILEKLEDYPGAISEYRELTRLNPKENYYFIHMADLLRKTNQMDEALATIDQLERNAGSVPAVLEYKVDLLAEMGRWDAAIKVLEQLHKFYPDNTEYLHSAASYSEKAGKPEQAAGYYAQVLEIDPEDSRANLASAERFRSSGEDASYLISIKPIMANQAIDLDAKIAELIPFVEKYVSQPDPSYAQPLEELIETLVAQYPDEAKVHALYADFLYHSGNLNKSAAEYEKTLVLDKSVYQVWEQLLWIRLETNDPDALLRTSENALNVFPNQGSIYYLRGLAYAYKDDFTSAESELQQALIMSGRNENLRFNVLSLMGKVYFSTGEIRKGVEALDKALALRNNDVELKKVYSALIADKTNDPQLLSKAETMAREALAISGNPKELQLVLARITFKKQDFSASKSYMENAMDAGAGDDFLALELYGDILYSLGDVDKAVEYWTLSQETGNQSELLKRKIAERKIVH